MDQELIKSLGRSPLFDRIAQEQMQRLLNCLNISARFYKDGQTVLGAGRPVSQVGVLRSGSIRVQEKDRNGHMELVEILTAPAVVGAESACAGRPTCYWFEAGESCEVVWLDYKRILSTCWSACSGHRQLIGNLYRVVAQKSMEKSRQISLFSKRTIRDKILAYLEQRRDAEGTAKVVLDLTREELADYLKVDRSALCRELTRMKEDGLIRVNKNEFELL